MCRAVAEGEVWIWEHDTTVSVSYGEVAGIES